MTMGGMIAAVILGAHACAAITILGIVARVPRARPIGR